MRDALLGAGRRRQLGRFERMDAEDLDDLLQAQPERRGARDRRRRRMAVDAPVGIHLHEESPPL
jgi:hypothetical protein